MPTYAVNKKARHEYEILDTVEAGLVLTGQEVKSIRTGNIKLLGSYVTFHEGNAELLNLHIPLYRFATNPTYVPDRTRRLLLNKKELAYLYGKSQEKGLTILPVSVYTKGQRIKIELAVGRGKKLHDKRQTLKDRDVNRKIQRLVDR